MNIYAYANKEIIPSQTRNPIRSFPIHIMKATKQSKDEDHHLQNNSIKIWDCGSPLYDAYEMVAISHIVERHFMSLPYLPATAAAGGATKLLAPSDHHTHYPSSSSNHHKPAAIQPMTTTMKSSVLSFLMSPFVEKRSATPWKRKLDIAAEKKMQRAKRHKVHGVSMLFHFPWKKI